MISDLSQPTYSVLDLGFDKSLTKALLSLQGPSVTPELSNVFTSGVAPRTLISGELISSLEQQTGVVFSGKTVFDNTETGYRLGFDTDDVVKFYIGNTSSYLNWTGTALVIAGSISATTIDIGGSDATSFHVDINGNIWSGASTFAAAPFSVSSAGAMIATSATISGVLLNTSVNAAVNTLTIAKSANTVRNIDQNAYTKIKEFAILVAGSYDVVFDLTNSDNNLNTYCRIYVNGVATGTERTESTAATGTYNETITVVVGDLIQFYGHKDAGKGVPYGTVTNFRLRAVIIPNATVNTD